MNVIEAIRPKGGENGNQTQRPVNGRKPAQEADLRQIQMPQSQLHGKNSAGEGTQDRQMPYLRHGIPGSLGQSHTAAYSRTGLGCKPEIGGRKIKREGSTVIWR